MTASTVLHLTALFIEWQYFTFQVFQGNAGNGLIFCKSSNGYHITHYKHYCFYGNNKKLVTETISSNIHQYLVSEYFYAISRLPVVLIFVTLPKHDIFNSKTFTNFRILTAVFVIHTICLFVTFLTFQRLIAAIYPVKFPKCITKRNILQVSMAIYATIIIGFSVCATLIVKLIIESVQIDRVLCWLSVIESLLIVISLSLSLHILISLFGKQ